MLFQRKKFDLQAGYEEWKKHPGSVLLDVREPDEFSSGHLPGAVSLPLSVLDTAADVLKDRDARVYVYCRSGARAAKAEQELKAMGYHAVNIGGILDWNGPVEY